VTRSDPLHDEAAGEVAAAPALLFAHLDEPQRLSRHMEQRSMAMMGSTMTVATDAQGGEAPGSVIRMNGRVFGIPLALEEVVTRREPPRLKAWETIGEPHLLVIGAYRMGFAIAPRGDGSLLTVFIDYQLPTAGHTRWLARWLAPMYARWCCARMVRDAQDAFRITARQQPAR
jgi:hypothetical protein